MFLQFTKQNGHAVWVNAACIVAIEPEKDSEPRNGLTRLLFGVASGDHFAPYLSGIVIKHTLDDVLDKLGHEPLKN